MTLIKTSWYRAENAMRAHSREFKSQVNCGMDGGHYIKTWSLIQIQYTSIQTVYFNFTWDTCAYHLSGRQQK